MAGARVPVLQVSIWLVAGLRSLSLGVTAYPEEQVMVIILELATLVVAVKSLFAMVSIEQTESADIGVSIWLQAKGRLETESLI